MTVQIKVIDPATDDRWDDFVLKHPNGNIYHHSSWGNLVTSTYHYEPFYVALENTKNRQLEGIVPFMLVKSRFTGQRLVSLPLTAYCGGLVPEQELIKIVRLACDQNPGIIYVELKCLERIENDTHLFYEDGSFVTHILNLSVDLEKLYKTFHSTSIRQRIRRAERNKLKLRIATDEEDLKDFYKLETAVRRKHGLPPQAYSFFANMWSILKPDNFLVVPLIEYEGKVIAAATVLRFKDTHYLEYSASDPHYRQLCANQMLIWEVIKMAHGEGAKYFDFGRSSLRNRSLIDFKERWGAKKHQLQYYYYPEAKRIASRNESGLKRKIFSFINRRLPMSLLQLEGKLLYPHFG